MDSYISHHGVLGMKWGVRRYQPYSIGYQRKGGKTGKEQIVDRKLNTLYEKMRETSKDKSKERIKRITDAGLNLGDKSDTLNKGVTVQRIANISENVNSNKRKYVSFVPDDNKEYIRWIEWLADDLDETSIDTYVTTNKLKIASAKRMYDDILDKYGNETVNDFLRKNDKLYDRLPVNIPKGIDNKKVNEVVRSSDDMKTIREANKMKKLYSDNEYEKVKALDRVTQTLVGRLDDKEINSELVKKYSKEGYDAMVDITDAFGFTDYPLIVFKPSKTLKNKSRTYYSDY